MERNLIQNGLYQVGNGGAYTPELGMFANSAAAYFGCQVSDIVLFLERKELSVSYLYDVAYAFGHRAPLSGIVFDSGFCSSPFFCSSTLKMNRPVVLTGLSYAFNLFSVGTSTLVKGNYIVSDLLKNVSSVPLSLYSDVAMGDESVYVDLKPLSFSRCCSLVFSCSSASIASLEEICALTGSIYVYYYKAYNKNIM